MDSIHHLMIMSVIYFILHNNKFIVHLRDCFQDSVGRATSYCKVYFCRCSKRYRYYWTRSLGDLLTGSWDQTISIFLTILNYRSKPMLDEVLWLTRCYYNQCSYFKRIVILVLPLPLLILLMIPLVSKDFRDLITVEELVFSSEAVLYTLTVVWFVWLSAKMHRYAYTALSRIGRLGSLITELLHWPNPSRNLGLKMGIL